MQRKTFKFLAIAAWLILTTTAYAIPPDISLSAARPTDGSTLLVARTAANNPLGTPTFQLKADVFINNTGPIGREIASVTVSYPGSSIGARTYTPTAFTQDANDQTIAVPYVMQGNDVGLLPVFDGLDRDLSTLPATVRFEIYFVNDSDPLTMDYGLAFHDNAPPLGAYFFPSRSEDLPAGQYWQHGTRHVVDSGGGANGISNPTAGWQKYAIDMSVVRWDGSGWTSVAAGAPADPDNDDYLSWAKPLYSMADGEIVSCYRGEQDHAPGGFDDISFDNTVGNSVSVRTGNEVALYAHFMFGSIPMELCPGPGQNDGLSIPVEAGQFLGLVGNTGRSTAPHIHFQINASTGGGPNRLGSVPMQFLNVRTLADETSVTNLGQTPSLKPLHGATLHKHSLVRPNPCGFELPIAGAIEQSRHGLSAACYQDTFNLIVTRGYRPVFVDGFDVDGETLFNATFRSGGPNWGSRHGMTGTQYQDYFNEMTAAGFRPLQADSYIEGGGIRYAAIFDARPGPGWGAFHGLGDQEYGDRVAAYNAAGLVPVHVSTVEVNGTRYWTGLFERDDAADWAVESVRASQYQDTFNGHVAAGRIPFFSHGYTDMGTPWITGIWIKPVGNIWQATHNLDKDAYQNMFDANTGAGRLTRYTSGYDDGVGTPVYTSLWRSRPSTNLHTFPAAATNESFATFGFDASIPFASFRCTLDGGLFGPCSDGQSYVSLTEGWHTFQVAAVDRQSVADPTPSSFTWVADYTPPVLAPVSPPEYRKIVNGRLIPGLVITRTIEGWGDIVVSAADNLSGVAGLTFEVDGVRVPAGEVLHDAAAGTWSYRFVPVRGGYRPYTISINATDRAGNPATMSFELLGVPARRKSTTRQGIEQRDFRNRPAGTVVVPEQRDLPAGFSEEQASGNQEGGTHEPYSQPRPDASRGEDPEPAGRRVELPGGRNKAEREHQHGS